MTLDATVELIGEWEEISEIETSEHWKDGRNWSMQPSLTSIIDIAMLTRGPICLELEGRNG